MAACAGAQLRREVGPPRGVAHVERPVPHREALLVEHVGRDDSRPRAGERGPLGGAPCPRAPPVTTTTLRSQPLITTPLWAG